MATTLNSLPASADRPAEIVVRCAILAATIATALIHASLGGWLFTANAVGYVVLAVAMVAPGPFAVDRWLVRLALLGFTTATVVGWLLVGARFPLAYIDKTIELVLIALLMIELWHHDGGPTGLARRGRTLIGRLTAVATARS